MHKQFKKYNNDSTLKPWQNTGKVDYKKVIKKMDKLIHEDKNRQAIYDKSWGVCWYCGDELKKGWHADHFFPIRRNPDGTCLNPENDNEDNKVPSCPQCNGMKSSMDIEGIRSTIEQFVESLNKYSTQYKFAKKYGLVKETGYMVSFWFEENV